MNILNPKQFKELVQTTSPNKYPPDIIENIALFMTINDFRNFRLVDRRIYNATISLFVRRFFCYLAIEFTFDGPKKLLEISHHSDITGEVRFGRMLQMSF
jgi:hypothetical protein